MTTALVGMAVIALLFAAFGIARVPDRRRGCGGCPHGAGGCGSETCDLLKDL